MRIFTASILFSAALVAFSCNPKPDTPPAPPAVVRYSVEDFLASTRVTGTSFSPDGQKILIGTNQTGVINAYAIPVDGSTPVQLTKSTTDAILPETYFPNDDRFLYSQDEGGNELDHLFVQELDGTVRDLTPGEKVKARFGGFSLDDRTFLVLTNERDPKYFDVYEYATDGYARTLIFKDTVGLDFADGSPDRRYLAFQKDSTTTDADILLHDRKTNETKNLTAHTGEVKNDAQRFSADGKSLYYLTDDGSEFAYAVRHDLDSGTREVVAKPNWDVMYVRQSRNGKYLVTGTNADSRTEVQVVETATNTPVTLPELPAGDLRAVVFSRDEGSLAFYVDGNRTPQDLFVCSLDGKPARQLTRNLNPTIDPANLVDGSVVRFASHDGTQIPGILYRPKNATSTSKVPALVWVHGGPGGQSRIGYSGLIQAVVNHGYAVFAINNRGSSGYGKTFYKLDDRNHGEGDLGDCVASKKMLADTGWVDPDRIGILGGSYGGYMVLAALTLRPDEFQVGVDLFGISNWVRTLENVPPWWESFRVALYREMGDPKTDAERLRRISPLFHAEKVTRPLLVLQGKNDPRVLKQESDDIVAAVKAKGVPVEYIVFDDEGHGFVNKANEIRGYNAILAFLDTHLAGAAN